MKFHLLPDPQGLVTSPIDSPTQYAGKYNINTTFRGVLPLETEFQFCIILQYIGKNSITTFAA